MKFQGHARSSEVRNRKKPQIGQTPIFIKILQSIRKISKSLEKKVRDLKNSALRSFLVKQAAKENLIILCQI